MGREEKWELEMLLDLMREEELGNWEDIVWMSGIDGVINYKLGDWFSGRVN